MTPLFTKLNLTTQKTIFVFDPPESFQEELSRLRGIEIIDDLKSIDNLEFVLIVVSKKSQIDKMSPLIAKKAQGDAIVWFAYPKGTSKMYECDFNRDNGWNELRRLGFDSVRQVAID